MSDKSDSSELIPKKKEEVTRPSSDLIKRGLSLPEQAHKNQISPKQKDEILIPSIEDMIASGSLHFVQPIPGQISVYMENLLETYSRVKDYLPDKAYNVRHGFTFDQNPKRTNRYYCWTHSLCTHLDVVEIWLLVAIGGKKFMETKFPTSFFWFGSKYRERIEIFLMMHRDKYKFYFMDIQDKAWWNYVHSPSRRISEVQHQLDKALDLWETGNRHVIYNSSYGWFDTDTMRFERDTSDPEHRPWAVYEAWVNENPASMFPLPIFEMVNIDEKRLIDAPLYS